jgi:hypothetical protein
MSTPTEELRIDLDAVKAKDEPKARIERIVANADGGKDEPATPIEVEVADEAPKPAAGASKTDDEVIVKPEDGIAKLQKQLDDERALRQNAERRAEESSQAEVRARTDSHENQLHLLTSAITQIKQSNDFLKAKYREARAAGDADAEFDVQTEISTNAARLIQLEAGKAQLEKAPKPTARVSVDPVEKFVSTLTPRSAAWVRANPEFVRDANKNRKMLAAHEISIADGNVADTDEYFASIEQTLGIKKATVAPEPKEEEVLSGAAAPTSRKPAPAAAPVSRSGNGTGSRPNAVTLSPEEVEMASLNGQTPEEYARHKIALKKLGRLN